MSIGSLNTNSATIPVIIAAGGSFGTMFNPDHATLTAADNAFNTLLIT
jgi:hypothetical protein